MLKSAVISAPFGNYVRPAGATPTLGTFTAERRRGRVWRVAKTLRYVPRLRAWTNRIGLRNPGLGWLRSRVASGREGVDDSLVSVHGFSRDEWLVLIEGVASLGPLGIELNLSCPNVGEVTWPADLFARAVDVCSGTGVLLVAKLPPVRYAAMLDGALEAGVRCFHCCNTLPVPAGGLSGKPLMPLSLECIGRVRERSESGGVRVRLIGGGGITRAADVDEYARAGADHVAIGTKALNPLCLASERPLRPIIERASRVLGGDATAPASGAEGDRRDGHVVAPR